MTLGAVIIIFVVAVILILTFYIIGIYNIVINARNKVLDQFAQIEIEIDKRADLISDLVDIIRKYAKHEENTLHEVISVKDDLISAGTINEKLKKANEISIVLNKLFSLVDTYPEIRKNTDFKYLEKQLKKTEDKIDYAKPFYNTATDSYNELIKEFPYKVVARLFKLKEIAYFGSDDEKH